MLLNISQVPNRAQQSTSSSDQLALQSLMSQIITQKQDIPDENDDDKLRTDAKKTLAEYLSLPVSENDTFSFWSNYGKTTDRAQKSLCKQARIFLTPAPTSTDVERLFSTAGTASISSLSYHFIPYVITGKAIVIINDLVSLYNFDNAIYFALDS